MVLYTIIIVVIALIGILMALAVLLQSGKGGGLAGIASSAGGATQMLGARQAPDVLEKFTWTCATIFIVLCIASNFLIVGNQANGPAESIIQREGVEVQDTAPAAAPSVQPVTPAPTESAPAGGGEDGQ